MRWTFVDMIRAGNWAKLMRDIRRHGEGGEGGEGGAGGEGGEGGEVQLNLDGGVVDRVRVGVTASGMYFHPMLLC